MSARAGQGRIKPSRRRVSLADKLGLYMSESRRIDGLWVGSIRGDLRALDRVEEALRLIKTHDPIRYARLLRDLDRVWVTVLPTSLGSFTSALKACELDERFVLAETSKPEKIAATIVHEATHHALGDRL
jgi:hypothetical protein